MFYLLLGLTIIALLWIIFGTYRITAYGEIRKGHWSLTIGLVRFKYLFTIKWQNQSSGKNKLMITIFTMSVPARIRAREKKNEKNRFEISVKNLFGQSKRNLQKISTLSPLILKLLKKIKVMELSINGQMSLWDPATSGIIYGLSQWVRSYPISPVDIRIYPLFYPDESAAICHLKIKFCVASILYLMFRERHIWKPMISGNR